MASDAGREAGSAARSHVVPPQGRRNPSRDSEIGGKQPALLEEAQKRTQCRDHQFGASERPA